MTEIPIDFNGKLKYFKLNLIKKSVRIMLNTINLEEYTPRSNQLQQFKSDAYIEIEKLKRFDDETNLENFKEFLKKIVNIAIYLLDNDELYKEIFLKILKKSSIS